MDSMSLGDEVRFRTSPDIIDNRNTQKSHSWTRFSDYMNAHVTSFQEESEPQRSRMQAVVNKDGLIELDFGRKNLNSIPGDVFTLVRLEVLKVNKNNLKSIPSGIARLHKLRILHAQQNEIVFVHETLANCIHLQYVDLSNNKLTLIPRSFNMLRNIKVLKLMNNQLEMVPHEMGDMSSLRQLELSGNKIWHLPSTFSKLQNVRYLNLSRNRFDQLPMCVCSMKNLEALDVHGNQLNNLPPELPALKSLKELSIANNNMQSLPHAILSLRHLHSLDASYNKLRSIPHQIGQLPKLRMLIVQGNNLVSLPPNIDTLHYLNIANNKFQNFSVISMRQLQHLNASHNNLENMPLGAYNLVLLEVMKLNNNNISYLSQDIMLLRKLRVLDLSYNRLTMLPQIIDELERLEVFNIKGNKIEARKLVGGARMGTAGTIPGGNSHDNGYQFYSQNQIGQNQIPQTQFGQNLYSQNPYGHYHQAVSPQYHPQVNPHSAVAQQETPNGLLAIPNSFRQRRSFRRRGLPVYRKHSLPRKKSAKRKKLKATKKPFFPVRGTKNRSTQHITPIYHQVATQYTPRSTVREHDPLPLDTNLATDPSPHSSTKVKANGIIPTADQVTIPNAAIPNMNTIQHDLQSLNISHNPVVKSNPFSVSEISYPMISASAQNHTPASRHEHVISPKRQDSASYTQDWIDQRNHEGGSGCSNTVTINEAIGDNLSLGEEDFEFLPTNIPDRKLMRICREAESLLNTELLKPLQGHKGIFKKSLNEGGTLRTLHGITGENSVLAPSETDTPHPNDGVIHMSKDIFLKRPKELDDNGILRLKMDVFRVTPSGGLFKSSIDPNISLHFPANAVSQAIAVTMQIEKINPQAIEAAKKLYTSIRTLLAVGDIVHIKQSREVDFKEQVTITIPSPPLLYRGKVHLIAYREDNTCSPCSSPYRTHQGYISLQAWHFSGRGAVLTKTKDKFKACKAMEQLLQHLYV